MEYRKIVYDGLCCCIASKAAFIRECMKSDDTLKTLVLSMLEKGLCGSYCVEQKRLGKLLSLKLQADDETLTQLFNQLILKKIANKNFNQLGRMLIEPALCWDGQEIRVESLYFLVFAIVKNVRCRELFLEYAAQERENYFKAYRQSEFFDSPILKYFVYQDRLVARLVIGLIALIRQEQGEDVYYRQLMDIVYRGYKAQKNCIKKMKYFESDNFRSCARKEQDMIMALSLMMLQLVIAEDLNIPIEEDYFFYQVILMMQHFEEELMKQQEECFTKEGAAYHKKIQKIFPYADSYYYCYYLGSPEHKKQLESLYGPDRYFEEEEDDDLGGSKETVWNPLWQAEPMERLFTLFQLNLRMMSEICLEQNETRILFELFGEMGQDSFLTYLLIASLCKYIHMLEQRLDEEGWEEFGYQSSCLKEEQEAVKREQQRLAELEKRLREQGSDFLNKQRTWDLQEEKLQERIAWLEGRHQKEKEELIALRNFAYQLQDNRERTQEDKAENPEEGVLEQKALSSRLGRPVVIGGHPGWQKKMKKQLENALFLSADNTSFDAASLRNREYIIINTDILKHACYYRIMSEKGVNQKVLYVHGNNVERCLREICRQLASR